jgi:5-methylcytosine-specific restriction protein A
MLVKNLQDVIQGKATIGKTRSKQWPSVRKQHLKNNPVCAVCGGKTKLEVHHKVPFHQNPELELDPNNLITLCESKSFGVVCHLFVGHAGNYKKINKDVDIDAAYWRNKLSEISKSS